jgi:hypothetical protein
MALTSAADLLGQTAVMPCPLSSVQEQFLDLACPYACFLNTAPSRVRALLNGLTEVRREVDALGQLGSVRPRVPTARSPARCGPRARGGSTGH